VVAWLESLRPLDAGARRGFGRGGVWEGGYGCEDVSREVTSCGRGPWSVSLWAGSGWLVLLAADGLQGVALHRSFLIASCFLRSPTWDLRA